MKDNLNLLTNAVYYRRKMRQSGRMADDGLKIPLNEDRFFMEAHVNSDRWISHW